MVYFYSTVQKYAFFLKSPKIIVIIYLNAFSGFTEVEG